MFENSIFSSLDLPCTSHPKQKVTHMCTLLQCSHICLICQQCRQSSDYSHHTHQLNLKPCIDGLNQIAALVDKDRLTMQRLYKKTAGRKQNQQLIRWQEEKERHYFSIQNHVNSMKYQLEQQLATIQKLFEKVLIDAKRAIITELDNYYKTYKDNFELFSRLIDPLVAFNRSHKYFSNVNNLVLKLMTETPRQGSEWLNSLKSSLIFSQKMSNNANDFTENLERGTSYMNSMVDSLPMIQNDEKKVEGILKNGIVESLRSMLRLSQLRNLNNILNGETAADFEKRRKQKY